MSKISQKFKKKKERPVRSDGIFAFWTEGAVSKSSDKLSVENQEMDAALLIGGKPHAGSGSSEHMKSDASSDRYQVEAKQTQNQSISLKVEWLDKISREAISASKSPMMHFRFLNCSREMSKDWVLITAFEFQKLFRLAQKNFEHDE